jgi:hypothetical protein
MSKRIVLKLIKSIFKDYAYVKDFRKDENTLIIELKPYANIHDVI